ncbi:hypothetical protein HK100_004451, partial [Physocladia obscura]
MATLKTPTPTTRQPNSVRKRAAPVEEPPKQTASAIAITVLFLLIAGLSFVRLRLPGSLPSPYPNPMVNPDAPPSESVDPYELITRVLIEKIYGKPLVMPEFDARDAYNSYLAEILKLGPRPFSSKANIDTADFIVAQLEELQENNPKTGKKRLLVERDQSTVLAGPFEKPLQVVNTTYSISVDNIIVKLKGRCELLGLNDCPSLLISAHYDAVVNSPGATDDGMAVATILEIIRLLADDDFRVLPHSLIFLLNNGEECGLLGARHFTKHRFYKSIRASINLEGGGSGGPAMLFRSSDLQMVNTFSQSVLAPHSSVVGNDIMNLGLVSSSTDYNIYTENGEAGIDIAFYQKRYFYHTSHDAWTSEYISSLQHMADSALKTAITLTHNEKFMRGLSNEKDYKSPGVYWNEIYGYMFAISFEIYQYITIGLLVWLVLLIGIGLVNMRKFIAGNARQVKNVYFLGIAGQYLAAVFGSFVFPIAAIAIVEVIRPLAIYGHPVPARVLTVSASVLGAILPFSLVKSIFLTTNPNAGPKDAYQEMLNWHVSEVGLLTAWVPIAAIVSFSAFQNIGLLYSHAGFIFFGCAAFTYEWFSERPWFGKQAKQGDSETESEGQIISNGELVGNNGLRNRKPEETLSPVPKPKPKPPKIPVPSDLSTPTKRAEYRRAQKEAIRKWHRENPSLLPNWFPVFSISIVLPYVNVIGSTYALLLGVEPTIIDGTPSLSISILTTVFTSIAAISSLPYFLTSPKTIRALPIFCTAVAFAAKLTLLGQLHNPFTTPTSVAPFTPVTPLKLVAQFQLDLTYASGSRDTTTGVHSVTVALNTQALQYVSGIVNVSSCDASLGGGRSLCGLVGLSEIPRPVFPTGAIVLDVETMHPSNDVWEVIVRSELSRVCFIQQVNGDDPLEFWIGGGVGAAESKQKNLTVSRALSYTSKFNEVSVFSVSVDRARNSFGLQNVDVK